jgi:hypothetical protein
MQVTRPPDQASPPLAARTRGLVWAATGSMVVSIGLMVAVGILGPSVAVPNFPSAAPWPPYFATTGTSEVATSGLIWLGVGVGGLGLVLALIAARRGWRPTPRVLIGGGLLAVIALVLMPPIGSTDMMDYAVYGRITVLGHSPYRMTPAQLEHTGDPVGDVAPFAWRNAPSVYGPLATASEAGASALAGTSAARTIFWLKVWNGLAYLAVALALDRMLRSDATSRVRAHLLWTVNPLMLFAVLAGGHIDGLAAAVGFLGLVCLRRLGLARGLAAGILIGAAIDIKAPFALYLAGLAWAARRSPRTLAAAALGVVAVLVPSYLLAGRAAVRAVLSRATGNPDLYQPWQLLNRALGQHPITRFDDTAGLVAFVILAVVLLWRMPSGLPDMPFVMPALALSLAWLAFSPQQRPWYDAMIFPLVALMPATRLDWVIVARAVAATAAELPGVTFYTTLRPHWLSLFNNVLSRGIVPLVLVAAVVALLWLCLSGRWAPQEEPAASAVT